MAGSGTERIDGKSEFRTKIKMPMDISIYTCSIIPSSGIAIEFGSFAFVCSIVRLNLTNV